MYKYTQGQSTPLFWQVEAIGDTLHISRGLHKGSLIKTTRKCKGKNIGKANETTPEQQAVLEANARVEQKRKEGYFDTIEEAHRAANSNMFSPMLAKPYSVKAISKLDSVHVQPKLNGVRCIAVITEDAVGLYSRQGNTFINVMINHTALMDELRKLPPCILDGELYLHGTPLQKIVSWVKSNVPETQWLDYMVFDKLEPITPFKQRYDDLKSIIKGFEFVNLTPCRVFTTFDGVPLADKISKVHQEHLATQYEGTIIRDSQSLYEVNKRSTGLLKLKDFKEKEFRIIAATCSVNKEVIWVCEVEIAEDDYEAFEVVPVGSLEERRHIWNTNLWRNYIGKYLTVRYSDVSEDGIPIGNPVGIVVRDYE